MLVLLPAFGFAAGDFNAETDAERAFVAEFDKITERFFEKMKSLKTADDAAGNNNESNGGANNSAAPDAGGGSAPRGGEPKRSGDWLARWKKSFEGEFPMNKDSAKKKWLDMSCEEYSGNCSERNADGSPKQDMAYVDLEYCMVKTVGIYFSVRCGGFSGTDGAPPSKYDRTLVAPEKTVKLSKTGDNDRIACENPYNCGTWKNGKCECPPGRRYEESTFGGPNCKIIDYNDRAAATCDK